MTEHTRRSVLKVVGASTVAVAVAGCLGSDDDDDGNEDTDGGTDEFEIEPGTTIMLEGRTVGWEGLEPEQIAGETNPTLVLEDGGEYEIGWEQGDGSQHNIELWNEDGQVVDGYAADLTTDPDEVLAFTATDEIAHYRCNPHSNMQGDVRVA